MTVASSSPDTGLPIAPVPIVERRRIRIEGALLGVSLTGLLAAGGAFFWAPWWIGVMAVMSPALVIGGVVGFVAAIGAVETTHPLRAAFGAAVRASLLGIALTWIASVAGALVQGATPLGIEFLFWVAIGLVYGLLFSLPVTVPIALLAVAVLRRRARDRTFPMKAIAVVLALDAVLALLAASGLEWDHSGGSALNGPVELTWTVANRSPESYVIFVGDPDPGEDGWASWGGSTQTVPGCFFSTDVSREADDWYLEIERASVVYEGDGMDFPPPPSTSTPVSATDVPGPRPAVWIEIAPDGTRTVIPNRAPPSIDEQTADLCGPIEP